MGKGGDPVTIVMVEDDPGQARLIEKNIRVRVQQRDRADPDREDALAYFLGPDGSGEVSANRTLFLLLDLQSSRHERDVDLAAFEGERAHATHAGDGADDPRRQPRDTMLLRSWM